MLKRFASIKRVAAKVLLMKNAGELTDISKLRYQAIFMMGAPGSGKGFISKKLYHKYMPGMKDYEDKEEWKVRVKEEISEKERNLSNLNFKEVINKIRSYGFKVDYDEKNLSNAQIPFRIYDYDDDGEEILIPKERYEELPQSIRGEVMGLEKVIFSTPKHELPSYWRVVDPDLYKKELSGYLEKEPGFVHEMSSEMSKAYFEVALETGDPLIIDGTGANTYKYEKQIKKAHEAGYRVTLIWVYVPLMANHIRNLTRERKVRSDHVTSIWKKMRGTWDKVSPLVEKKKIFEVFDIEESGSDAKKYKKNKDFINNMIKSHTGYNTLYEYLTQSPDVPEGQKKFTQKAKWLNPNYRKSDRELRLEYLRRKREQFQKKKVQ